MPSPDRTVVGSFSIKASVNNGITKAIHMYRMGYTRSKGNFISYS